MAKGNRRLFFDWANRGNKRCLQFFNDAPGSNDPRSASHAGNGFLMRRGYTIVWLAWQGDLLPGDGRQILDLPVATDGSRPISGPVRVEFIADQPGLTTFPLSGRASTRSHPTVSLDTTRASLTRRRYPSDARIEVPAADWLFARVEGGSGLDNQGAERAIVPSDTHIHVPAGFETGWIYELIYEAKDPLVLGLGHVAVRDFISFLKYEDEDAGGTRQSAARTIGPHREGLWLGALAERALHPRFRPFRLQRGHAEPARVRWRAAACGRRRPVVDEPSLRQCRNVCRPAV